MNEERPRIPQAYLDGLRDRIILSDLIGRDLQLQRSGKEWKACCPFHKEKSASFYVNDQKRFMHCFGCGAHADAFGYLMRAHNLQFEDAVTKLADFAGQPSPSDAAKWEAALKAKADEYAKKETHKFELSDEQRSKQAHARTIWRHAKPFLGSPAETYLRGRGIHLGKWPPCLRYVARAMFGWEQTEYAALIAAIQDGNAQVTAIQTTFILSDGSGKVGITPSKPVLGPMADGAVRLGKPGPILGIAEGIETALSARQLYSLPVWATCGASRLGSVKIPEETQEIIIFGDNGERGQAAAKEAAEAYGRRGFAYGIVFPDPEFGDFNDALQQRRMVA